MKKTAAIEAKALRASAIRASAGIFLVFLFCTAAKAQQSFRFALLSDTHIGNETAAEDLRRSIRDINGNNDIRFVLISGDITEFGSDAELRQAKQMLDSLQKPWYIIPGNHDDKWSESGTNSFKNIFGAETFSFVYGGFFFLGTNCGPNMRMGPGQVPHENIVWMDSVLKHLPHPGMPVVFVNHYPIDPSLNNWYQVIDLLKQYNTQLILCGHGHANHRYNFEDIPGVMGRSNLRAKDSTGGYNIVSFAGGTADFREKRPFHGIGEVWTTAPLQDHHFASPAGSPAASSPSSTASSPASPVGYPRPSYAINQKFPQVRVQWQYQAPADIGCGLALAGRLVISADTKGRIFALDARTGKIKWAFPTNGKVFSTPAIRDDKVVVASTDGNIYCLRTDDGKLFWTYPTHAPIVASPLIHGDTVYIGSSDGHFRAFSLSSGALRWDFQQVKGFVETRPLLYEGRIYFGSWDNDLYALKASDGQLLWKWNNGSSNRMFSPAACSPVAAGGKLFIVAPDRYMTAFDAVTGEPLWRRNWDSVWVRESIGLSTDSSLVYVKTMQGNVVGISVASADGAITWRSSLDLGYELDPAAITEFRQVVYTASDKGLAAALDRDTGKILWMYKLSNCLVNAVVPSGAGHIFMSTMDGKIVCLKLSL